ncbi:hypothetical protein [Flammeovirga aprica]|uniref:DUF4142 domain-containing protein n=1 Tax=Flammeovirga aprica JL-4 TaxID=694437 RepID=A0A7X9RWM6_9BACT|nr:hypothetical protein [Flammeovirga aprica]NME70096.1 hypothetical protein [Flammeovirga aprica JL-4]
MKTLSLSIIFITFFSIFSAQAQNHIAQEAFDVYWNSLAEDNNIYSQERIEKEKLEVQKVRKLIQESIKKELQEVKELSGDLVTNFAVIEDHLHQEFEKLGLSYTHFEKSGHKSAIAMENWVDNHTTVILKHKLSHAEQEINTFYDRNH